jgi:hypothetical protein
MLESLLWITHARQAESIATNENDQHLLVWPYSQVMDFGFSSASLQRESQGKGQWGRSPFRAT